MEDLEQLSDKEQTELLKKALGLLKVFGPNTPSATIDYLKYALGKGICTREDIDNSLRHYSKNYGKDYLDDLFN